MESGITECRTASEWAAITATPHAQGEVDCPAAQARPHGCICAPGTQQTLCSLCITMAAAIPSVRQGCSGFLARAATCAWNALHQPLCHTSRLHELQLHDSESVAYSCSASEACSSSKGVHEVDSAQHGFMWMGKGDMRTFRGKVSQFPGDKTLLRLHFKQSSCEGHWLTKVLLCSSSEAPMGR